MSKLPVAPSTELYPPFGNFVQVISASAVGRPASAFVIEISFSSSNCANESALTYPFLSLPDL